MITDELREQVKNQIRTAFTTAEYPGDANLRNSSEGDEPFLLEAEFKGKRDWRLLSPAFIDQAPDGFGTALSFFSPEALRFYLPAFLIADLDGRLRQSDPLFALTHGLTDETRDVAINPRRYGDYTWFEYAQSRFATCSPTEAEAIVAYLRAKRHSDLPEMEKASIDQALLNYWQKRMYASGGEG